MRLSSKFESKRNDKLVRLNLIYITIFKDSTFINFILSICRNCIFLFLFTYVYMCVIFLSYSH